MSTDTLGRRLQWGPRQPRVERFAFTDADFAVFQAITRHGPLPSRYLYEFTKHLRRDETHLKNRLTELYHGSRTQGHFLDRPPQQYAQLKAHARHVVYDLAPKAKLLLAEHGPTQVAPPARGPFVHQLMTACVGASIELTAPDHGLRYISRNDILSRSTCPAATRASANPLAIPIRNSGHLIPDDLFGLEYPGVGFRFFAVEIDRHTESIVRRNIEQTAFARKIDAYLAILHDRSYRLRWGVPNLSILTVTTSDAHAENLAKYFAGRWEAELVNRFWFAAEPNFGPNWRVPSCRLDHLCSVPWLTAGRSNRLDRA